MLIPMLLLAGSFGIMRFLVVIVIALLVISFLWWAINKHAPEPLKGWATTIVVLVALLFLIWILMGFYNGEGPQL